MTSSTLTIARVTLAEALRDRLLYNLVVFAVLLVAGSLTISQLTLGDQFRIIANIGTSATQVFGLLIAVFLGVGLVSREMDRRTCYPALARPVSRAGFVVGKYLGLLATLGLNVALMAAATGVMLSLYVGQQALSVPAFAAAFALTFLQLAVAGALAVLFSTFSTATLSAIFALSIVGAGWLFGEVRAFWVAARQVELKGLIRVLDALLPNMSLLDLKESVTYGDPVTLGSVLARAAYGAGYAGVLVALAALVFSRRDVR
ncbi:MAG TPA: ABC transporter permease [Anaeromyxobacteraceae bacterium]|nr:ABC transporter permease [Anaeromyxobacteraceae bacterium]